MASLQFSLFAGGGPEVADAPTFERVALDDTSWVDLSRAWLLGADTLLEELERAVEWRQGRRRMYDRVVDDPRLSHWYRRDDEPPHPSLTAICLALEDRYRVPFTGPGLNYYRDGDDSVAFHRDRELRDLDEAMVAIVTLGAARPFLVRPLGGGRSIDLRPASGDLLVMGGRCQAAFEHGVPKVARAIGPRLSLSYRWSRTPDRGT